MSRNRYRWLLGLVMVLAAGRTAHAQYAQPFIDPATYDMDFRWFQPLYGAALLNPDRPQPHEGPYFTYSRSYLNVSRPNEAEGEDNGDWSWGNRYDFGYMLDKPGGWNFTYWNIDSPNEILLQDNVNRNEVILADLLGDPVGPLRTTLNNMEVYGFEANRSWRVNPRSRAMMYEPFVGARYIRVTDYYLLEDFEAIRIGVPLVGPPNGAIAVTQEDNFFSDDFKTANDLFGGQFGVRMTHWRGRWRLVTDIRGMVFHNFQDRQHDFLLEHNERTDVGNYDDDGNLEDITVGDVLLAEVRELTGEDRNVFTYGGELRLEAIFDLTRNFALSGGLEVLVLADGVGRGTVTSDEAFMLGGATVGLTINR